MRLLGIAITVTVILLVLFSPVGILKETCRSHDSFLFLCHHNDTNTDIYLRRIAKKLDMIFDQVDRTPKGDKTYREIERRTYRALMIVSCTFEQLRLLKKGNINNDFFATKIIPTFLLHYDNIDFDRYTDTIVSSLTEYYNYTREEAALLRKTSLNRANSLEFIMQSGLDNIKYNLYDVIEYETMVVEENNFINPENLEILIHQKIAKQKSKKSIMQSIIDEDIKNLDELCAYIRATHDDTMLSS